MQAGMVRFNAYIYNPLLHSGPGATFGQNFDFKIRINSGKNLQWAPRLPWVGRR